ncbi:MAG: hypothetical protein ACE5HE_07130, partial [Phycisphaerae bacterium]
ICAVIPEIESQMCGILRSDNVESRQGYRWRGGPPLQTCAPGTRRFIDCRPESYLGEFLTRI